MPNWTSNTIRVSGDASAIREFLSAMSGPDDQRFDFNSVIPMPDLLRHTGSGFHKFGDEEHRTWYVITPGLALWDEGYAENLRPFTPEEKATLAEIGADSWYDWSVKNWGTKWNACNADIDELSGDAIEIRFETAWSAPFPVFEAIAAKFQHLNFAFSWTNEGEWGITHSMDVRCGEGGVQ